MCQTLTGTREQNRHYSLTTFEWKFPCALIWVRGPLYDFFYRKGFGKHKPMLFKNNWLIQNPYFNIENFWHKQRKQIAQGCKKLAQSQD